jgi:hypothetical protein
MQVWHWGGCLKRYQANICLPNFSIRTIRLKKWHLFVCPITEECEIKMYIYLENIWIQWIPPVPPCLEKPSENSRMYHAYYIALHSFSFMCYAKTTLFCILFIHVVCIYWFRVSMVLSEAEEFLQTKKYWKCCYTQLYEQKLLMKFFYQR